MSSIGGIAAGIVTYNPELTRLRQNIEAILPQVDCVIITDNGSGNLAEVEKLCAKEEKIVLVSNETNMGIAKALNQIFEKSMEFGHMYTLTLDQDSISPDGLITELMKRVDNSTAITCPFIHDINRVDIVKLTDDYTEVKRCITSGALTLNKAWKSINGFDEEMFIDGVDFDFCDRLIKCGYRIIQVNTVELIHEIGKIETKYFLGVPVIVRNHSAFRKYYIAKNIMYLDRKNKVKGYPIKAVLRIIKQWLLVLLYEDDKIKKLKAIIHGAKDGATCKVNDVSNRCEE